MMNGHHAAEFNQTSQQSNTHDKSGISRRANVTTAPSSSSTFADPLRLSSSSDAEFAVDASESRSQSAPNNSNQHSNLPTHDSISPAHSPTTSSLNSFLKWFRKSPVLANRPRSQPPSFASSSPSPSATLSSTSVVELRPFIQPTAELQNNRCNSVSVPRDATSPTLGAATRIDTHFDGNSTPETLSATSSLSLSSLSSLGSVYSTATNGFAFIPPEQYAPQALGFKIEKRIAVGPVVTESCSQRSGDRRFAQNLRQKYNLYEADTVSTADDSTLSRRFHCRPSPPPDHRTSAALVDSHERRRSHHRHRRTCSDSSKDLRAGAYLHVKGKRKAPAPPTPTPPPQIVASELPHPQVVQSPPSSLCSTLSSPMSTLRRRKRQAPAPPQTSNSSTNVPPATPSENRQSSTHCSPPSSESSVVSATIDVNLFSDDEIQAIMSGNPSNVLTAVENVATRTDRDEMLLSTDTLKLEYGLLKHNDTLSMSPPSPSLSPTSADSPVSPQSSISPRPWYKRSSAHNRDQSIPFKREISLKTMEKRKHKSKAAHHSRTKEPHKMPEIAYSRSSSLFDGFFARVTSTSTKISATSATESSEKRRSAIGIPNISELDREAAEIIRMEEELEARNAADRAAELIHDKYYELPATVAERPASTKELISRFEETNPVRVTVNTSAFGDTAMNGYFAEARRVEITATTLPTTSTSVVTTTASTTIAIAEPTTRFTVSGAVGGGPSSRSSMSTMSANGGASNQNRALSPPPKPARATTAAEAADALPTNSTTTSMMQRIFSNDNNGGARGRTTNAVTANQPRSAINTSSKAGPTITAVFVASTSQTEENPSVADATQSSDAALAVVAPNHKQPSSATTTPTTTTTTTTTPSTPSAACNSSSWICSFCTLENFNWRVICEVCERMRPFPRVEPRVGPAGDLVPTPRFRYNGRDASRSPPPSLPPTADAKTTTNDTTHAHKPQLIDSSAVLKSTPQVFVAPFPAEHGSAAQQPPDLDAIRAVRIEKFAKDKSPMNAAQQPSVKPAEKTTLLSDRGSLEREKQRLRELIREMNAKALVDKYPITQPTTAPIVRAEAEDIPKISTNRSTVPSDPQPIPVGRGAIRKIPQPRKNESPEDKVISDTTNYIFDPVADKTSPTKTSSTRQSSFGSAGPPRMDKEMLLSLPSPVAEQDDALSSLLSSGPNSPNTQQRLVDEQFNSIYARLKNRNIHRDPTEATPPTPLTRGLEDFKSPSVPVTTTTTSIPPQRSRATDTLALNKLLKNLEHAIEEGEHDAAAKLAMDLAHMKVSLKVTKQHNQQQQEQQQPSKVNGEFDMKITNVLNATAEREEEEGATALPSAPGRADTNGTTGWTCPLCTLINDAERSDCATCSERRPATVTGSNVNSNGVKMNANRAIETEAVRLRTALESKTTIAGSNDLDKKSLNRRSAEIFNIVIRNDVQNKTSGSSNGDQAPKTSTISESPKKPLTTKTAITSASPNITRTKYRGVDNYNPYVNPQVKLTYDDGPKKPYKSPLARTNASNNASSSVKITAVTLKNGEKIAFTSGHQLHDARKKPNVNGRSDAVTKTTAVAAPCHYTELLNLDNCALVPNTMAFECVVCFGEIAIGSGVVLRDCLHQFCRECLKQTVRYSDEAEVRCPYMDDAYSCDSSIQEREIRGLLSRDEYERHLAVSLSVAELRESNAFHCRTPGCRGWCIYEDNVNEFRCPICRITNCLTCRVVHDGLNCKQYQDRMSSDCDSNDEARRTGEMLNAMIDKGEAMKCPLCQVVLMKKWGCDWLKCSMCKTEICWVTRGIRWGPEGKGDTSAGCRCGVNGIKCHPKCNYCH